MKSNIKILAACSFMMASMASCDLTGINDNPDVYKRQMWLIVLRHLLRTIVKRSDFRDMSATRDFRFSHSHIITSCTISSDSGTVTYWEAKAHNPR